MSLSAHPFKIFFVTVFFVSALTATVGSSFRSDVIDNITAQIQKGNAAGVAIYFNDNIEISLLDKEGVYSKAQGQNVLQDFFSKNPLLSFTLMKRGQSSDGIFCIGTYSSTVASYRIYYLVSQKNGTYLINKFSVTKQ